MEFLRTAMLGLTLFNPAPEYDYQKVDYVIQETAEYQGLEKHVGENIAIAFDYSKERIDKDKYDRSIAIEIRYVF